jgi:hypothetical protein
MTSLADELKRKPREAGVISDIPISRAAFAMLAGTRLVILNMT